MRFSKRLMRANFRIIMLLRLSKVDKYLIQRMSYLKTIQDNIECISSEIVILKILTYNT